MPEISNANKASLGRLVDKYNALPWYKKLFYPGVLGAVVGEYNKNSLDSAFAVCNAFLNKTWFFQRWFFSSLVDFSKAELGDALYTLKTAGLLTGDAARANFDVVASHRELDSVASALRKLKSAGLLTGDAAGQANFNATANHPYLSNVVSALQILNTAGLLTGQKGQANFNGVVGYKEDHWYSYVSGVLRELKNARLLTSHAGQANFDAVINHPDHPGIYSAVYMLQKADLLTSDAGQANFSAVIYHPNPSDVFFALTMLKKADLFTQDAFNLVMIKHTDVLLAPETSSIWGRLWLSSSQLTQENFNNIIRICKENHDLPEARSLFIDYINHHILREARPHSSLVDVESPINTEVNAPGIPKYEAARPSQVGAFSARRDLRKSDQETKGITHDLIL